MAKFRPENLKRLNFLEFLNPILRRQGKQGGGVLK